METKEILTNNKKQKKTENKKKEEISPEEESISEDSNYEDSIFEEPHSEESTISEESTNTISEESTNINIGTCTGTGTGTCTGTNTDTGTNTGTGTGTNTGTSTNTNTGESNSEEESNSEGEEDEEEEEKNICKKKNDKFYKFDKKKDFQLLKNITSAPSAAGYEASMTYGVIEPYLKEKISDIIIHKFLSSASIVAELPCSNKPNLNIMFIVHADKIRMQVRYIDRDGKIYINADSYIASSLLGHKVTIYTLNNKNKKEKDCNGWKNQEYVAIEGRIQAILPIHYADSSLIRGNKGVKDDELYIDIGCYTYKEVKKYGIQIGDPVLMVDPVEYTLGKGTYCGSYLDNGVGCFVLTKLTEYILLNKNQFSNIRCLFAIATHEEINRFGSRVIAKKFNPDILIGLDACHDYVNAPGIKDKRFPDIEINKGLVLTKGSVTSTTLNDIITSAFEKYNISYQVDIVGRDTGNDAMAGFLSSIDTSTGSIGIPILNMHTNSESGSIYDLESTVNGLIAILKYLQECKLNKDDLMTHVNLLHTKKINISEYKCKRSKKRN